VNEKDLSKALLHLDATDLASVSDPLKLTRNVLERDRRRVRRLTVLTVGLWLLAAGLILLDLINFGLIFPAQEHRWRQVQAGDVGDVERDAIQHQLLEAFEIATVLIGFSVAIMAVAALCSVLLILASRRATLRQVNASLLELSEQLKRLHRKQGAGTAGPA
jgi:hypothetical protein